MAAERPPLHLSQYMVLLGSFQRLSNDKAESIDSPIKSILGANPEFAFDHSLDTSETINWASGSPPDELRKPLFGFRWEQRPKNGRSFILGALDHERRDKSLCACDFQLAESNRLSRISRRQLSIDIYPQPDANKQVTIRLTCLPYETQISFTVLLPTREPMKLLQGGDHIPIVSGCVEIGIHDLRFCLWIPTLTQEEIKERGSLAYQFELNNHSQPSTYFPTIHEGVDTQYDNMRTSDRNGFWLYNGKDTPSSTDERPFFTVWNGKDICMSAWQPDVPLLSSEEITQERVKWVQRFCDAAAELSVHALKKPNVFQFTEVAVYRGHDYKKRPDNLPWAIGERLAHTTESLVSCLRLSKLSAVQRLSVFQQICSALAHAHRRNVTHGYLGERYVLVTQAQDHTVEAKVFGFFFPAKGHHRESIEGVMRRDIKALGYLGFQLFDLRKETAPLLGPDNTPEMVEIAEDSNSCLKSLLVLLLTRNFTAENAKHLISGFLADEDAVRAFTEELETRKPKKRELEARKRKNQEPQALPPILQKRRTGRATNRGTVAAIQEPQAKVRFQRSIEQDPKNVGICPPQHHFL
ncbi:hypothetical protein GQX73_g1753 [Xylaria multiplex]|uniref:Protein kinase domain-containing protein n=1 Tax=Xylaria multiplex TaxID=323545 RepID=A0A7C8NC26_9PEZI|nr:hypothetical protein GQX73_g1753 [Xylaria multiplex]